MTQLSDEFALDLSLQGASRACRTAVANAGWNIRHLERNRIVPSVSVGLTRNPSSIEVVLAEDGVSWMSVALNGRIGGVGPLQKSHLQGEINRLRNAIEVAAS